MAAEAAFIIADSLIYAAFAIVFVVGTVLAYFVISLIGGS
jgi:hypothetical protein